ncbi:hypothetical protein ACWDOR_16340 [Streptosporangium canum]
MDWARDTLRTTIALQWAAHPTLNPGDEELWNPMPLQHLDREIAGRGR